MGQENRQAAGSGKAPAWFAGDDILWQVGSASFEAQAEACEGAASHRRVGAAMLAVAAGIAVASLLGDGSGASLSMALTIAGAAASVWGKRAMAKAIDLKARVAANLGRQALEALGSLEGEGERERALSQIAAERRAGAGKQELFPALVAALCEGLSIDREIQIKLDPRTGRMAFKQFGPKGQGGVEDSRKMSVNLIHEIEEDEEGDGDEARGR